MLSLSQVYLFYRDKQDTKLLSRFQADEVADSRNMLSAEALEHLELIRNLMPINQHMALS